MANNDLSFGQLSGDQLFTLVSGASHEAILLLDDKGKIAYASSAAFKITGREKRQAVGKGILEFLKPLNYADEQRLDMAITEAMPVASLPGKAARPDSTLELSISGKKGKETCVELSLVSEKFGERWYVMVFFRDVTDKMKALESLQKSERKYRKLFEGTQDAILMTTPDGKIVDINRAGLAMFGYRSKEEMMKIDAARDLYFNPEDRVNFKAGVERYGSARMHDLLLKRRDGTAITVSATVNAVYDEEGEAGVFHSIMRDITGIRQLERQVESFQKMDAVRGLIGDIAHHFNNILNIIVGNAQLAKISPDCSDPIVSYLSTIEDEAFRAADMVDELLASGSRHPMDMRTVNIVDIVGDFEKLVRNVIGTDIALFSALPPGAIPVRIDIARIGQVLLNIVVNAREAMSGTGTLTIRLYTEQITDLTTTLDGQINPGTYAVISIADTGRGIKDSLLDKIFEPFFTTDASGERKGLGLSVVLGIVKQHGGFVICESEEGKGATFRVYVPVSTEKPKERRSLDLEGMGGSETVLIGEDEEALREIMSEYLTMLGYRVIMAEDGREALNEFRERPDEIDIALLDIAMPGMGGFDVYHGIRELRADIPVMFMTGYNLEAVNIKAVTGKGINAIRKPFTMAALARKIRTILDQEEG
jgi:two-component system, cell cycle sensor histidine kinase and response regulator CckA